jgi:hypothetical protein
MPVEGGEEIRFLKSTETHFAPARNGVYFVDSRDQHVKFFDFRSRSLKTIAAIPGPIGTEISISPDEQWMLFSKQDRAGSELMLVDNFR